MRFVIKVVPRSSRQGFASDDEVGVKCYVKAAPEGGKANRELIKQLSKKLHIPQSSISLLYGGGVRVKMFELPLEKEQNEIVALLLSDV